MKNDEDIQFQLSELLDGNLRPDQADALLKRVVGDPALAEELRLYQSLEEKLSQHAPELPPVDWELQRETIHSLLEREALLKVRRFPAVAQVVRWGGVAAAAAAMIFLALWLMPGQPAGSDGGSPELRVAYESPAASLVGEVVLASGVIVPEPRQLTDVDMAVSLQSQAPGNQNVRFERVSALTSPNDRAGTVVVSVGQQQETASSGNGWFFRDLY